MNAKQENFKRIAENRVNKIIDMISKLENLNNTSFYEYSDEQMENIFEAIQKELDKQKELFNKSKKSKKTTCFVWCNRRCSHQRQLR